MKGSKTHALLFATFLLSGSLSAQVVNGGFETPAPAPGGYTLYTSGSSFPGWNVIGPGSVAVVSGSFTQNGITFEAEGASGAWLDLTGTSNSAAGVQQSIATTVGTTYDVSFWVGNVVDQSGLFGTTSTVLNVNNGGTPFTATNSSGNGTSLFWQKFTTSFVANSANTTLSFTNGDPSSDNSNGLDNVSVSPSSTVPEPTSIALLGTGLIGLVPMIRRKR